LSASVSASEKPADAVPPGRRAEQHGEVADAAGLAQHEALDRQCAQAEHVHERVFGVDLVEHRLAPDGGHAHGVAVTGYAVDDALGDPAAAGVVERPEAERVHDGDGSGPHREDVAEDAAHPGGRALVGLDGGRVVMALDADGGGDTVAHVHHAGVLTGAHKHPFSFAWQSLQVQS
jgi:hypothetical protein